ncbi:MAG: multifunctional oxoglutarate decarboxylase/oxoglutarate dehydrogenase thiamine pyrophosphate-binding subunit/dihydrolipoyllysine-residue succinyltransferase subunit, partial [Propionibacteriaceae bacterium]|nr:multifunctional oxoglutarate decarboxylase/oxoglutarate dehydrogenase thiamine pyrophosphate-binding subunit/dihydrolipoyllysine-residue succinyltransferase subunit [Propionibacteriaceae bacterium]
MQDIGRAEFGDNQWLIASMRDRYAADPASVPKPWATFFANRPDLQAAPPVPKPQVMHPDLPQDGDGAPVATVERRELRADSPATPGSAGGLSADMPSPRPADANQASPILERLRGSMLQAALNMAKSLTVPTATSERSVPMKLAIEQRATINNFMRRTSGGRVSFTHLIAYAMVKAIKAVPAMNYSYTEVDDQPTLQRNPAINLGIAIDSTTPDGQPTLLVPVLYGCEHLSFADFWGQFETLVKRAKAGQLASDDFSGATVSITNPGAKGTGASRPRLMSGQGTILGVGVIDYPASFGGTSARHLAEMGVSKVTTLTSTYDHRIIQGAQSGEFLSVICNLLLGADGFYDEIFEALRVPYPPLRWATDIADAHTNKDALVASLVDAYRQFGHLQADTDPLEYRQRTHPDLELYAHALTLWDLDRQFHVWKLGDRDRQVATLREILDLLRDSYCHTLGIEYTHIQDPQQRAWWQTHVEKTHTRRPREEQLRILNQLIEAEVFETFLQTKYVGQTRFSLEGSESAIVILAELCEQAADAAVKEVCIGMPHRGRLNVLTSVVGKLYSQVFREFDHRAPTTADVSGDVTYHLGADGSYIAASGRTVRCSVAANPSHLEAVNPVLAGIARAKLDRCGDSSGECVLPVLMHGDASFAGQGVVYETLQMSALRPYRVGGTIHVVVNNQVGFTTAPVDARSSVYCTDVAKTVQAPVLHVNGDDPDACARAAELAFAYRQQFHRDVVIDLVCYRRRGHNEGDDPSFTQPQMYDLIAQKRPVRAIFTNALIGRGDITTEDAEASVNRFRDRLEEAFRNVR